MRAPFQEGDFPGPVKYGYLNVGWVEAGPPELVGRTMFSLYPHQTRFRVPVGAVTPVPDGVPTERAVLAGIVETALNALWDAPPRIGDRMSVVGASQVGSVSPERRGRYTAADRLGLALDLLRDPVFDVLITGESSFDELPRVMADIAGGRLPGLCQRIRYSPI